MTEEGPGGSSKTEEGGGINEGGKDLEEAKWGGTYGLIANRLALWNWRTLRGGSLTCEKKRSRRLEEQDNGGGGGGGGRGWRRFTTTYHPTISVPRAHDTTTN